jgi:hypothetical protein
MCGWKDMVDHVEAREDFWAFNKLTDSDWFLIMTGAETLQKKKNDLLIEEGKKNTKLMRVKSGVFSRNENY